jgi:putative hydrolase of the HAD superfamily
VAVIFLDFFGTLVDYSPSRTEQGYRDTHALLRDLGVDIGYLEFLERWSLVSARFDAASDADDREFSMVGLGHAFMADVGRPGTDVEVDTLVGRYLAEWNQGVHAIDGVSGLLDELADEHRLAVVTNTHHPRLVPDLLATMGIADLFDGVITSVEVGWRKPHAAIYRAALESMGAEPSDAVFVGDTRIPDYDGPRAAGMSALLIDPHRRHDIAAEDRIDSVLDVPDRLP